MIKVIPMPAPMTDAPKSPGTHQSMLFFGDVAAMGDFDSDDFAMGLDVDCSVDCSVGWATDGVGAMTIAKVAASANRVGWMGQARRGKRWKYIGLDRGVSGAKSRMFRLHRSN